MLPGASGGFPAPSVVQASTKPLPAWLFTVTTSFVGIALYALSVHWYVHVASAGCGSHPDACAGAVATSASTTPARTALPDLTASA